MEKNVEFRFANPTYKAAKPIDEMTASISPSNARLPAVLLVATALRLSRLQASFSDCHLHLFDAARCH